MDEVNHKDLALIGLVTLAQFHGISINEADIRHRFDIHGTGLNQEQWLLAAKEIGLKARVSKTAINRLHLALSH